MQCYVLNNLLQNIDLKLNEFYLSSRQVNESMIYSFVLNHGAS